jgi:hypothetical protein
MTEDSSRPAPRVDTGPDLPEWVQDELANPLAMGEGRNNQMIKLGPTILRCGMDPEGLFELFCGMYGDFGPQQEREAAAVVKNAVKIAKREQKEFDKTEYGKRRLELARIESGAVRELPGILAHYPWPVEEIRSCGMGTFEPLDTHRRLFLSCMFEPDDVVWCGMVFHSGDGNEEMSQAKRAKLKVRNAGHFQQIRSWLQMRRIHGEFTSHCTFKPGTHSRCIEAVASHRYLVVESDRLTPDETGAVLNYTATVGGLNLRAVITTGGKSIHGWFEWPGDDDAEDWKHKLIGWRCDPATLRASQPVRLPGCIRRDTGRPQELIYLNPAPTLI